MKVVILSSLKQEEKIKFMANIFINFGAEVVYPKKEFEKSLLTIDIDYIKEIHNADMVIAIPKDDGSFGESVTYEMALVIYFGKEVFIPYSHILHTL